MKQKSLLLIGNFGYSTNRRDGQTIKTRAIGQMLQSRYAGSVRCFDTSTLKGLGILGMFRLLWGVMLSRVIIMVPASNALAHMFPILYQLTRWLHKDLIHLGVGGWQVEFFLGQGGYEPHPNLIPMCKKIKGFLVEINHVKRDLIEMFDFRNIEVFSNFRFFDFVPHPKDEEHTIKLVFMARIHPMKGYALLFQLAQMLQQKGIDFVMDIYGPIEEEAKDFCHEVEEYQTLGIQYRGILLPEDIYKTLNNYDILLFPTRYFTEGFPGTILDAYISGIPVIATAWKHAHEFIADGFSGYVVPFEQPLPSMIEHIEHLYADRVKLKQLKQQARETSRQYSEESAWQILSQYL